MSRPSALMVSLERSSCSSCEHGSGSLLAKQQTPLQQEQLHPAGIGTTLLLNPSHSFGFAEVLPAVAGTADCLPGI